MINHRNEKYYYETPMWAVALLCLGAILLSFLFVGAFYYWERWFSNEPNIIRWFFLFIGSAFLIAGVRPRNWKPWRYFFADNDGLHFPSECPETKNTKWLLVTWNRVGCIKKEVFYSHHKGPSIELQLQSDEINLFFRDIKSVKIFFDEKTQENGFFKVGYSNAFKNADHTAKILNEFKRKAHIGLYLAP